MTAAPTSAPPPALDPSPAPVRLPPTGDGSRSRRRRRRERRRAARRVLVLFGLALFVPLVVVPALEDDRPAGDAAPGDDAAEPTPPALPVLAAVADEAGLVSGLALLVPAEGGGGAVLLVPAGAMVEVPSFGLQRIGDAARLGGAELLRASAENLVGVPLGALEVLDGDALAGLVGPVGSLRVDVPDRIEAVGEDGRVRVLFEQGATDVAAGRVHELLTARDGETDLGRLVRHQAFWEAWLDALRSGASAPPGAAAGGSAGSAGSASVAGAVAALATGPVEFHLTPVEPVAAGAADGADLYRVLSSELAALVHRLAPGVGEVDAPARLRVQLLNGTGEPGLAQAVTPRLVPAGAEVKLVGNADRFDYETTQIVYYDPARRDGALAVREALGVGQVVRSRQRLDVVELTVVVGHDFLDTVGATAPADQEGRT